MSDSARSSLPAIAWVYLGFAVIGAATPWTYNLLAIGELGRMFTPVEFVQIGFTGPALLGSVAADFWIGSLASIVWLVHEARRLGMPRVWLYLALTLLVAWAFALPLFLHMRERHLAARAASITRH